MDRSEHAIYDVEYPVVLTVIDGEEELSAHQIEDMQKARRKNKD